MTDDVPIPVRVVFRRWRDGGGVIALFPELPADAHGIYCDSYEHVGQHGGADYHGVVRHTAPAAPEESAALAAELTSIGYRLAPVRRASPRLHERRREEARRDRTASPPPDTGRACVTHSTHPGERRWPSASAP